MVSPELYGAVPIRDIVYRSHDDLKLYACVYGHETSRSRPVICLPGLTRNTKDFEDLAVALATHHTHPRLVYCLDYRGRGRSEWDKNWQNYSPFVELLDVANFIAMEGLVHTAIIGTSRGGIIAMLLSVVRPSAVGCVVLNDIGPVIETAGLARIIGYAGKVPVPRDWDEARRLVRDMNWRQFTALADADWDRFARTLFHDVDGKPGAAYDPAIGKALSEIDIAKPVPEMWPYFEALHDKPVMVLRGENSDILSVGTVQEMQARHSNLMAVTIQNEGHAPLLRDRFSQRLIGDFLIEAERTNPHPNRVSPGTPASSTYAPYPV